MEANKPSSTASLVALGTFLVVQELGAEHWDSRVKKYLSEILRHLPLRFSVIGSLLEFKFFRVLLENLMSLVIPGMFSHYVARKIFIESHVKEALASGCKQLVVIGGGLDTLALRTHASNPDLRVIELDHPATQTIKRQALGKLGRDSQSIAFVAVDLTQTAITEALCSTEFDPHVPTVFVIEGVLMYLSEDAVKDTLSCCASLSAQGSRIIATFLEKDELGRVAFKGSQNRLVGAWLQRESEPFIWGLAPDRAAEFFSKTGNRVCVVSQWDHLFQAIGILPRWIHPPARGEHIAVLEPIPKSLL